MSTSPSWFDPEKFSRLVKKVGQKTVPLASSQSLAPTQKTPIGAGQVATDRIPPVSQPTVEKLRHALPSVPRRTGPMPSLKTLFPTNPVPEQIPVSTEPVVETQSNGSESTPPEKPVTSGVDFPNSVPSQNRLSQDQEDLAAAWQKIKQLNDDMEHVIRERDEAIKERIYLQEQLMQATEGGKEMQSATQTGYLSLVTQERDQARRDYANLRKQWESLQKQQVALIGDEKLIEEINLLREQLTRTREETSIAKRGLALSQKALKETRDTLREATDGTAPTRHNFDNLKNECSTLLQQNAALQAQIDQLTREIAATKNKVATTRL